jgi:2-dehydropantoate 2-reductase
MKIGVVGCGALGSYYGALLGRDRHEVHFLLRSDHAAVRRRGVFVTSPDGDFNFRPRAALEPAEIGPCDLVLIGLKTTANDRLQELTATLVAPHTAVVTLQNGLGNEARLAAFLPREQILGGLCFVCLNRTAPGHVRHLAHGRIVLGEYGRWPEPRTHDLADVLKHAGIPCQVTDDLARAHWEKLIWNIPFNGLGVAAVAGYASCLSGRLEQPVPPSARCAGTDILLGDERWTRLVRELMHEVIRTSNALGLRVRPSLVEKNLDATRIMGAYRASTLVDFERGAPLELESLFLEPLRQATAAGVTTPRLAALCRLLQVLDPAPPR